MKLFFSFAILSLLFYACVSQAPYNPGSPLTASATVPAIPETVEPPDVIAEQPELSEPTIVHTVPDTVTPDIVTPDTVTPATITPPAVTPSATVPEKKPAAITTVPETVPELPERPDPPVHIMGEGIVPKEKLAAFLLWNNTGADDDFVHSLTIFYIEESAAEGINYDTAFAQMCLETGFLRYGGLVTPDMNNFCGLGATGPAEPGLVFPDPRTGVRAHIQHLKAYATPAPLNLTLVDPRYYLVRQGSSPTIHGLSGTWAVDRFYSEKINDILHRMYEFSF
jgi:hypothetical protein